VSDAQTGRRHPEGWQIGRLLGVPVVLARSWFVIAAVVTLLFAPTVQSRDPGLGAGAYVVAFVYALLLFGSVLLHEVAHAGAARAFGMPATRIVINLWGGHTQFESDATTPWRSFVVAFVGPLVNAVLALAALPLMLSADSFGIGVLLLSAFVITNAFVAVFNIVPGLPLDGGRMLEAVVWRLSGDRNIGTIIAGWGGRLVAAGLVVWAVILPIARGADPSITNVVWAGLIGALLWSGAGQSIRTAQIRRRAPTATVRGIARPAVGVPATVTVAQAMAAAGVTHPADLSRSGVVLVAPDGRPAAVLVPSAVGEVPPQRWAEVPAASTARALPVGAEVDVRLAGEELLRLLGTLPGEQWAVRDETGRVVGLLYGDDVVTAVLGSTRSRRGAASGTARS
jgi:Zn-dependent protease